MTDQINPWITQWFEHEAKVVNDEMFRTSALIELCKEKHITPRSLTEDRLIELWVLRDKIHIIRPILAKKILEYYGLQWREMKNSQRVKDSGMTREHYEYISSALSIEWCFAKFLRMNCWDRVDHDWEWTQYDKIIQQFPTPENASQKVIKVDQKAINETLIGRFTKDLERIEQELKLPITSKERKEALENSKTILEHKLEELNAQDNTWWDW